MAKWQASKSDMSPRKGYIPEIKESIICYCPNGEFCDVENHNDEITVCSRCGDEVSFSDVSDGYYAWCRYHGEDLYEFETKKVDV
jgi:hypothetical protein